MHHKRAALLILFLLAVPVVGMGLWLRSARHQNALNHQLIDALVKGDDRKAIALVNAGADPNTRYKPTPVLSLSELVRQLFHRSPLAVNNGETAFMIACGSYWNPADPTCWEVQWHSKGSLRLLQAMLRHGAPVNMKGRSGRTPLICAASLGRTETMHLLLEHHANVNVQDEQGDTALILASHPWAALSDPDLNGVRLLLTHQADPNLAANNGETALGVAEANGVPHLPALLRHAGARK